MNHINDNDLFKDLIKGKLADYKGEVPFSGWEKLEGSLIAAQKTKVLRKRWITSSVAAVAAALIGVFFIFQNMNKELSLQTSQHQTTPIDEQIKPTIKEQSTPDAGKTATPLYAVNTPSPQKKYPIASSPIEDKETSLDDVSSDLSLKKEKSESITNSNIETNDKASEIDERTKQQLMEDFINEGNRSLDMSEGTKKTKRKSRHSISLSGQSGLSSTQQTNETPTTLRSSLSDSYSNFTMGKMEAFNEEKEINPQSETHHSQPVSFGVLTSFSITPKLQIETGLIYTYLSSETKNRSIDYNESEKVQFNYIGVPINLNYTLLSINNLDIFVTAGAMIEKDVHGRRKYYDDKKGPSINSGYATYKSSKIKQNNPQLSISSGVGVTYPLYDKAKLFGKFGARYNIDAKNEYITYYSDEKIGLDIQLGIKFNF